MKLATNLNCWLLLLASSSTGPVAVISFAPCANLKPGDLYYRSWDHCYRSQPKWDNAGGLDSRSGGSSSPSSPGDWNVRSYRGRNGSEGFRLNMNADGAQGVDDENENENDNKDLVHRKNEQQDNSSNQARMVDAEFIDGKEVFKNGKKSSGYTEPKKVVEAEWIDLKLREIAKKEGYDTTDMAQEDLEKIARWVQSKKLQGPNDQATKHSSVPLEELQAVALNLGYDPRSMSREALEQLLDWVPSQNTNENRGGNTAAAQNSYSSMPIEELQGIALHEGYDPRKMDRTALEKLMHWVNSPQYLAQKQPLEALRAAARNEGFDPTGMDRGDLEQLINWAQSKQQGHAQKQQGHVQQQQPTQPNLHSRNNVQNPVNSNSQAAASVPKPLEELREVARKEGYDPTKMKRGDLEKLVDWVRSKQYRDQKRPLEELRNIARSEGYDPTKMDRADLEQLMTWVQSQQYREKKQPLEVLKAVAISEGYDPTGMDRGDLEQLMDYFQSQQYHKKKKQSEPRHSKNGVGDSVSSNTPTKPLEELRALALSEGYDPKGMNRSDLEDLMDWIQSPQYLEQKQPLEQLRAIARNQGHDPKGMDRAQLEKLNNWVQSQQYHKQSTTPDENSKNCIRNSQNSNVPTVNIPIPTANVPAPAAEVPLPPTVKFSVPLEELRTIALNEGYQVQGMKRDELEKLVEWVQSDQYCEQKRPLEELRAVARNHGYDPAKMDRGALEQLVNTVEPQQHYARKNNLGYNNHSKNNNSISINSNVATVSIPAWPIEQLRAVAINEGYDPTEMSRTQLENVMKWVQSQQFRP